MKIKDYRLDDRPREKALRFGLSSLSDQELICLLIGSGTPKKDALQIAQDLLEASDNLHSLPELTYPQLTALKASGRSGLC